MAADNFKVKLSVKPYLTLIFIGFAVTRDQCWAQKLKCSQPDPPSLLEALSPVFSLSSIRPVLNSTTPTTVNICFVLYGILGVDEKAQLLTTYLWLTFIWPNEFISWDPEQCGTNFMTLPRNKFWVPDIVINEFMDKNTAPSVPYVYLGHNGTVYDFHPARVVSSCNLDIYTFPFDIQNCTLTFNSYIHPASEIKVDLAGSVEDILKYSSQVMTNLGEWDLLDITSQKHTLGFELFSTDELIFNIRLRRRATLYVVNLLIPSCFLVTVDLFSFMLPPHSVDRSSFKMTLILGYTVFLLLMNELLPVTGNTTPLINVFFSICLALMVGSLLETIIITNLLCASRKPSPVPHWVQLVVLRTLGCLLGLPPKPKERRDTDVHLDAVVEERSEAVENPPGGRAEEHQALEELRRLGRDLQAIRLHVDQQLTGDQSSEEWIQVGFVIDRLMFGLYTLFISVSFITMICLWLNSYML